MIVRMATGRTPDSDWFRDVGLATTTRVIFEQRRGGLHAVEDPEPQGAADTAEQVAVPDRVQGGVGIEDLGDVLVDALHQCPHAGSKYITTTSATGRPST